jgi:hypothetical protein
MDDFTPEEVEFSNEVIVELVKLLHEDILKLLSHTELYEYYESMVPLVRAKLTKSV